MTTFGLVHGAWHGGWCWSLVAAGLEHAGESVVVADLPVDEPTAMSTAYADEVVRQLEDCDDDVILVGHSLGGIVIPLVAAARPVRQLVYLCAVLRDPGRSLADRQLDGTDLDMAAHGAPTASRRADGSTAWTTEAAMTALYHDCTNEVATWAVGQLRPQFSAWYTELDPLVERAAVPTRFILCRDDRVLDPSWARRAAKLKLGVEAVEMPGGHCPMLARPAQLVTMLLSLS